MPRDRGRRVVVLLMFTRRSYCTQGLHTVDGGGNVSSWGGSVLQDDDGVWHMWAAQFTQHCGINNWDT